MEEQMEMSRQLKPHGQTPNCKESWLIRGICISLFMTKTYRPVQNKAKCLPASLLTG